MCKALLSLFVLGLSFFGFSNAQFVTEISGNSCFCDSDYMPDCSSICSVSSNDSIVISCNNPYCYSTLGIWCNDGGEYPNKYNYEWNVDNSKVYKLTDFKNWCSSNGYGSNSFQGFICRGNCGNLTLKSSSSQMPLSELSPVVNGLGNTIGEFIPYIVYIGIGILVACIGFVAIKRLINWVRAKIFSSFK